MSGSLERFYTLLRAASAELYEDNRPVIATPELLPTANAIDPGDVELFWVGVEQGLIRLERGGKFNTFDRPVLGGHWALLSRSKTGGWYNAEYLPQLASYVDAIVNAGYPKERVFFELPPKALQLDLAIVDDDGRVIILGEAKRETGMLTRLVRDVEDRFADAAPTEESKKRGDEARQLAWRLWTVRPPLCWLIGPGERISYNCSYAPPATVRTGPAARRQGTRSRPSSASAACTTGVDLSRAPGSCRTELPTCVTVPAVWDRRWPGRGCSAGTLFDDVQPGLGG